MVSLILPPARAKRGKRNGESNPVGHPLFEALRTCRRALAVEAGLPPYVIFHDSTLREMAMKKPRSLADLALISGIGERKRHAYGEAFLEVIRTFEGG